MKFLFLVTDFDMGGITTSLKNLSDELILRGNTVSILNLPGDNVFPVEFHPLIEFIPLRGISRYWNLGMQDYQKAKGMRKQKLLLFGIIKKILVKIGLWKKIIYSSVRKIDCDVAIAYRQSADCYYLIKNKTTAKRTIAFIHSEFDGDCSSWMSYLKDIDRIACVSEDWSKKFKEIFPHLAGKVGTVYNLFDVKRIKEKAEEFLPEYQKDCFNIVTVSRIESTQKKIEIIPEIYSLIQKSANKKIKWYIVGDGKDRKLVEDAIKKAKAEENVILLGAKKNPYPYIKNADLFVLTSTWESYGMVIMEALILGTPVVAGEYGALTEIIHSPFEGIITQNSTRGISEGIISLVNDNQQYAVMKTYLKSYEYNSEVVYNQLMTMCS